MRALLWIMFCFAVPTLILTIWYAYREQRDLREKMFGHRPPDPKSASPAPPVHPVNAQIKLRAQLDREIARNAKLIAALEVASRQKHPIKHTALRAIEMYKWDVMRESGEFINEPT